jgi:hypothetical protein
MLGPCFPKSCVVHHSILAHPTSATGQNPNLPHCNSNDRFTSDKGHNVGEFYLRCRPANLLALPSLLAFTRRRRRRFRRKGWPPPIVGPPEQRTTFRHAPQECPAPPVPLQWPAVTHSRPPVALQLSGPGPVPGRAHAAPSWHSRPLVLWLSAVHRGRHRASRPDAWQLQEQPSCEPRSSRPPAPQRPPSAEVETCRLRPRSLGDQQTAHQRQPPAAARGRQRIG